MNKNSELRELTNQRDSLINKLYRIRDEFRSAERDTSQHSHRILINDLPRSAALNEQIDNSTNCHGRSIYTSRETKMTEFVSGIKYRNSVVNWCHDNVYCYKADIVTKAVQFEIEITYERNDKQLVKILDMKCHFTAIAESCLLEMIPWIQECTTNKNYSLFTMALCDYDDHSADRVKILSVLKSKKYIQLEKCNSGGGGILVRVHPCKNPQRVYFKIQWSLKFVSQLFAIRDTFTVEPMEADKEFMKIHKKLIQSFSLTIKEKETNIEKLWKDLCEAIDNDYNKTVT